MPRWNEEALKVLTPPEWKHVAQLAHDLGWQADEALEEQLSEDDEVPTSQDVVLPLARKQLAATALLAPFKDERIVGAVFERNFWLGWRSSESGANTHTYIEAPGVSGGTAPTSAYRRAGLDQARRSPLEASMTDEGKLYAGGAVVILALALLILLWSVLIWIALGLLAITLLVVGWGRIPG